MKLIVISSVLVVLFFTALQGADQAAYPPRERPLSANWRFLRGDAVGAELPQFDDVAWRRVDLPHDWSIEDLPPRDRDPLFATITLTPGEWRFSSGDDPARSKPGFDDAAWKTVRLPQTWDQHGQIKATNPSVGIAGISRFPSPRRERRFSLKWVSSTDKTGSTWMG